MQIITFTSIIVSRHTILQNSYYLFKKNTVVLLTKYNLHGLIHNINNMKQNTQKTFR